MVLAAILEPIEAPLRWLLVHIQSATGLPWAWAIILLTFLVRTAMVPLTVKQQQSIRRMQVYQPQLKAIQQKYKDPQERNQKVMEFYRENNINPFAACLPTLVQLPVFIGLYQVLRTPSQFVQPGDDVSFLNGWIPDITKNLGELPTSTFAILMVIYVGSQVGASLLMPTTADPRQKYLVAGLPVLFSFFIITKRDLFPVGLMIYWITTNLWTCGQAFVIRQWFPPPPPPVTAALAGGPKAPAQPAGGGSKQPKPQAKPQPKPSGARPPASRPVTRPKPKQGRRR
jgi:YidC/Oxa1 family membrane protein insertase